MPTIQRPTGVQVTVPLGVNVLEVAATPPPSMRRGATRAAAAPQTNDDMTQALLNALRKQDMVILDQVPLDARPLAAPTGRRRGPAPAPAIAQIAVPVEANEDAVVLVERAGVYAWVKARGQTAAVPATRRGEAGEPRRLIFDIPLQPPASPPTGATRRALGLGFVGDWIVGEVKAVVIKYVARVAVDLTMHLLEHNVRRGLVRIDSDDPAQWQLLDETTGLGLEESKPIRLLLLIHGTFSSTIGGYGGLCSTPWGKQFLAGAFANYHAVLGFDHATLSENCVENADDLLSRLRAVAGGTVPEIDIVVHSRGGLVVRTLLEYLLPTSPWKPRIGRVIFVGAPNAGTLLAKPENWKNLIDLYTNLATAACRLIGMFPQAKAATLVLEEAIQTLGAFVKYCTSVAISDGQVPGLAVMEPGGSFITKLNEEQPGQPTAATSYYCAITSDFAPRIGGDGQGEPKEFPVRLLQLLAGGFMSQLMGEANDLVVNTASMTAIDVTLGQYVKEKLDFGTNPQVYHTNYFLRPEVCNVLVTWLQMAAPAPPAATGIPAAEAPVQPDPLPRATRGLGGIARRGIRTGVDTDIVVADIDTPKKELRRTIEKMAPSYVVLNRVHDKRSFHYALPADEVLKVLKQPRGTSADKTLLDAFDLDKAGASPAGSAGGGFESMKPAKGRNTVAARSVVLEDGRPVGVLPEKADLPNADALVELAKKVANPKSANDRILATRTLPTFPNSGTTAAPPAVTCYFHAEMDGEVVVNHAATVDVLVSREVLEVGGTGAKAGGKAEVATDRKLIVQAIPKKNFELLKGDGTEEIDPPAPGKPTPLSFDVKATDVGDGEVWIVVRQGQVPLTTLALEVKVVPKNVGAPKMHVEDRTPEAPIGAQPLNQLWITEQQNGDQVSFRFQLQLPEFKEFPSWELSKPLKGSRTQYVAQLYDKIEQGWNRAANKLGQFVRELQAFGGQLFDELIPSSLQQVLWKYRDQIKSIQVISEEPFIPWELVHLKEPGKNLGSDLHFLGQMGLVRWLHDGGYPPEQVLIRKDQARYVIPAYKDPSIRLQDAELEADFLKTRFQATPLNADSAAVTDAIRAPGQFDLLHFACHGEADATDIAAASLLLKGLQRNGFEEDRLSATTVGQWANLAGDDGNRPLVVLNACQVGREGYQLTGNGGFADAFIRHGAGMFVGPLWSIGDQPARTFTEAFYDALLNDKTLAEAAIAGRAAAQKDKEGTWLAYVVYGHPHAKLKQENSAAKSG